MNKTSIPEPDLDKLIRRALSDDIPPEAEARMSRQFVNFKHSVAGNERLPKPDGWRWMNGPFRKEVLAVAAAVMMILGLVMQLSGGQNVLAHSIEQLKVIATITMGLDRVSSMDCRVLEPATEGEQPSYRIRWRTGDEVRVDMDSGDGAQTLWISNDTVSVSGQGGGGVRSMSVDTMTPGPVWQPALEFMSPETVAKHIEEQYGLMQSIGRVSAGTNEFLIVGREGGRDVEVTVDAKTYLPKMLKKYSRDSNRSNGARDCVVEARFLWNRPIPGELFSPRTPAAERESDH